MNKLASIIAITAAGAAATAVPATAAAAPSAPAGYTLSTFATAPGSAFGPDDITYLDGRVFVGWQNGVGTKGEPGKNGPDSTLVEYSRSGQTLGSWQLAGKLDGLGANRAADEVIATVNEDGNSSLYTVKFGRHNSGRVTHYTYSPAPDSASSGGVFTGGGSDAVSVYHGQIILSASNPQAPNATAAFRVRLDRHSGIAHLYPTFADNAPATDAVTGKPVTLALTDPDSNAVVPESSPRFGGDFVLDSQGDQQLVFAHRLTGNGNNPRLAQLPLTHGGTSAGVDDIRWADRNGGTLYIVDNKTNTVYSLTGPLRAGEAFASLDTVGPNSQTTELDQLNLFTGELTTLVPGFSGIKGLVWASGQEGARVPGGEGSHSGSKATGNKRHGHSHGSRRH